jgi:hypothetical protein
MSRCPSVRASSTEFTIKFCTFDVVFHSRKNKRKVGNKSVSVKTMTREKNNVQIVRFTCRPASWFYSQLSRKVCLLSVRNYLCCQTVHSVFIK